MENIPANVISLIAFSLVMLVALLLLALKNRLSQQISGLQQETKHQELMLLELQTLLSQNRMQLSKNEEQYKELQLESEQVAKQLEHRIKVAQDKYNAQFQMIEQLLHQQPEDKLYSRAQKLVELGADVAEIMRECDIPRPEAEMLLAVHRQKSPKK